MRFSSVAFALFLNLPAPVLAQDAAAACETLAIIQNADCTVRRVAVCDNFPADWRSVAIYTPAGPTSLSTFDANGVPQRFGSGPGTPQTRLGIVADELELAEMFANGTDRFDYQLNQDGGSITQIVGKISTLGDTVTIDGRVLQVVQSRQTLTTTGSDEATHLDVDFLYDADLPLLITDGIRDPAKGSYVQHRSPVDFIFPGEDGFDDTTPRFGCGG